MTALEIAQRFESDTAKYPDTAERRELNNQRLAALCHRMKVDLGVVLQLISDREARNDA